MSRLPFKLGIQGFAGGGWAWLSCLPERSWRMVGMRIVLFPVPFYTVVYITEAFREQEKSDEVVPLYQRCRRGYIYIYYIYLLRIHIDLYFTQVAGHYPRLIATTTPRYIISLPRGEWHGRVPEVAILTRHSSTNHYVLPTSSRNLLRTQ